MNTETHQNLVNSKTEMKRISLYYPEGMHQRVKDLAAKSDISVNNALMQLIELSLEQIENNK
jgi:predicted HicB family RNase H-like nuclease